MFSKLKDGQLRKASEAMGAVASESDNHAAFVRAALEHLPGIVPSDLTTLSLCDLERGTRTVFGRQAEALSPADCAVFNRYFRQHPLVHFHGVQPGGPTQRISDCLRLAQFRRSPLFADYYRRIGINHVMALPLRIDSGNLISIVFNRGGADFSEGERAVLETLRPQLSAFYRNLCAREQAETDLARLRELAAGSGWEVAHLETCGRIAEAGPAAAALLRHYFPGAGRERPLRLPHAVAAWVSRSRNWGLHHPAREGEPFTAKRFGMRLTLHYVADPAKARRGYLLMKEQRLAVSPEDLAPLPITKREREILALVATGKSNPDIALVLGISRRTVQKHLEHIFDKLGVETRMAAALRALGEHQSEPS